MALVHSGISYFFLKQQIMGICVFPDTQDQPMMTTSTSQIYILKMDKIQTAHTAQHQKRQSNLLLREMSNYPSLMDLFSQNKYSNVLSYIILC